MASRGRIGRVITAALFFAAVSVLAGCTVIGGGPASVNEPAGDQMQRIWDIFVPIFWLSVGVFVIVQGILLYAVIRFRRKPGDPTPHGLHGNTKLEIVWTIIPALILAVIAVPTLTTIVEFAEDPGPEALDVRVTGYQWFWQFEYLDSGVVTAEDLHLPVDRPVRFELVSQDVIHSFWVPRIAGKQDVIPGHVRPLSFTPHEIGEFPGQCAEFCGIQHANMRFNVIVQSAQDFEAWLASKQPPAEPTEQLAQQGRDIFFGAGACVGCHTIEGTEAQGDIGPDLTHFAERSIIAGGVLPNTEEDLHRWLADPQEVKPGNKMVIPRLNDQQIEALIAFLYTLD